MHLLVTIAINKKENKRTSFLMIREVTAPARLKNIKILKYFFPLFNSSFVTLASRFPIGNAKAKSKNPITN